MQIAKLVSAALAVAVIGIAPASGQANPRVYTPQFGNEEFPSSDYAPAIDVWLDQTSYTYNSLVRPYFATDPGAYVTIIRVTTDGSLRVLYPRRPGLQSRYRIGEFANDRVPYSNDAGFRLHESPGYGFVFAIASYERFDYSYYTSGGSWSLTRLAGTSRFTDPFDMVHRFVNQILDDRGDYSIDYVQYELDGQRSRSRYATQFSSFGYLDYYRLCLNSFGLSYIDYCRSYDGRYYQPYIVVRNPNDPSPNGGNGMRPPARPVVGDPLVPGRPGDSADAVLGSLPAREPGEAAASDRARMPQNARPRQLRPEPTERAEAMTAGPRIYAPQRDPIVRSEPRNEPRSEPRIERQQPEPRMQAPRTEQPRSEPRVLPPPQHIERPATPRIERQTPSEPAKKDN